MLKKFTTLIAALCLGINLSGCGGINEKAVVFADGGWDSVKFHNAVAVYIAKNAYGLEPEILSSSTPILEAALVRGDVDVNMELWTDNTPAYAGDKAAGGVVELGINFDDNRQGFYVPRYVIEGDPQRGIEPAAPGLKTVADLAKYKEVFKDEEEPEKGRIYGAIPGWAIDAVMYKKYEYYGLDKDFVYFRPGSEATMNTAFMAAYEKGLPIVGYNYEPTWLSGKLDMVLLDDAPYDPQGFEEGKTAARPVPVVVAANSRFPQRQPEFTEFLKRYHTSSALTAEALAYIADNRASYDDAAIHFMTVHDDLLDKWLPPDKAQLVRECLQKERG